LKKIILLFMAGLVAPALFVQPLKAAAGKPFITLSSTTTTRDSGLLAYILPKFTAATGIDVRVLAFATGKAIRIAKGGDADVLLTHHRPSEEAFVAAGFGVKRYDVMYNDFIIAGPSQDPAAIRGMKDAVKALVKIAAAKAPFASRGDSSGTHQKELELWRDAGLKPGKAAAGWYRQTGSGMGATLNVAAAMGAYVLVDRGTWTRFANKQGLVLLVQGDKRLFNPYGVILVNPARFPHVKARLGQRFIDWLLGAAGQQAISSFSKKGERLFIPDAKPAAARL
jgi:tungstate transport system substrate-binding protein